MLNILKAHQEVSRQLVEEELRHKEHEDTLRSIEERVSTLTAKYSQDGSREDYDELVRAQDKMRHYRRESLEAGCWVRIALLRHQLKRIEMVYERFLDVGKMTEELERALEQEAPKARPLAALP